MQKDTWKRRIRSAMQEAGTYEPFFEYAIDTLAGILETRDAAREQYEASGSEPVIEYTNKAGATNTVKNPALVVVMELDTQALAYWKELGLTSKSYKQMNGGIQKDDPKGLEDALAELGI